MKKLMFAMAIAATVGFAQAELTSTGFETGAYTAGEALNTEVDDAGVAVESYSRVWAQATDAESTVKAYGADGAEAKPTITGVTAEELSNNYLAVEGKIERLAQEGGEGVEIGAGLYIDTIVQFTASDAETTSPDGIDADNDKLCIWLKSDGEEASTGHIVVTAGFIYNEEGSRDVAPVSYVTDMQIADKSWHHLQVKALSFVDGVDAEDPGLIGDAFVVYIDGQVVSTATCPFGENVSSYGFNTRAQQYIGANSWSLFPSIQSVSAGGTITSLTFNGSGSVDNIAFTQGNDPNPILIPAALEPVVASEADRTYTGGELTGVDYPDNAYGYELADNTGTAVGDYTATATPYPGFAWTGENNTPIYTAKVIAWSIVEGGSGSDGYDSGDGQGGTFTIDETTATALKAALPAGKTLGDVADATTGMTYAQAYALGLFDEETGDVDDLDATISVGADGKITVKLANAPTTGYLVTCKVYEKASLTTADWTLKETYAYGSEKAITPASNTAGFYKVEVAISNAQ